MKSRAEVIRQFLLSAIPKYPKNIVRVTEVKFNVSRTTVHRHLNTLLAQGKIEKSGNTSQIQYVVKPEGNHQVKTKINEQLDEFSLYKNFLENQISALNNNVINIISYGFTEIVNNAKDHSLGKNLVVSTQWDKNLLTIIVEDDGVGIFQKLKQGFSLNDLREGIIQLNKGKMTTDPKNHTGEGIFFSSRAFDSFEIFANNLHYMRDNLQDDWLFEQVKHPKGSLVKMTISVNSKRILRDLFHQFQNPDDYVFDRTHIHVELSKFGEETYISRSQAKRIVRGLEKFRFVTLDFKNVKTVGQGFVDEIFRVFQNQYPLIKIDYINALDDVEFMIKRGTPKSS